MTKMHYISTILIIASFTSCSTNKKLIVKNKTPFGTIKFYEENNLQNQFYKKRILGSLDNSAHYSFYSDKIVKRTKDHKELIYNLIFDEMPEESNDTKNFQQLTEIDSLVLLQGNRIIDSLYRNKFKKPIGAKAFEIEVNYYHGYPKNKRFKPE